MSPYTHSHQKEWKTVWFSYFRAAVSNTQRALEEFQSGTILVAKSHKTAVYQGAEVTHLEVGGPYQATGGMGDTLAGMVAGFLAQFASTDSYKAVIVATWLHSAIADISLKMLMWFCRLASARLFLAG